MLKISVILINGIVSLSVVCCFLSFSATLVAQEIPENVLQVAQQAWEQYLSDVLEKPWKVDGRFRQVNLLDDSTVFDNRFELMLCGANARSKSVNSSSKSVNSDGAHVVKASNERYQFRARSKDGSNWQRENVFTPMHGKSDSPLKIQISADDPVAGVKRGGFSSESHATVIRALGRGLLISENWFPAMTASQHFKFKRAEQVTHEGRNLTRIVFDYRPLIWKDNLPRDGWVDLDPERSWLIVRARTAAEWGPEGKFATGTIDITNSYTEDADGLALITRQDMAVHAIEGGKAASNLWTHEYTITPAHCSSDDFTLAAFGLSEPANEASGRSHLMSLLVIGNLLLVSGIIAFLVVRRMTRRRPSHVS